MKTNAFDEKYDIRLARYDEIDEIMQFIDNHWKKGHILATNRDFFEYEMVVEHQVNFVVAKERETGKIVGLHGFLMASQDKDRYDTWGAIWIVIPGTMGLLGLEIVKRLEKITKTRGFLSMGGNAKVTVPILKKIRKFKDVGKMQHFYCLSKNDDYKIAKIHHYEEFHKKEQEYVEVVRFKEIKDVTEAFSFENILSHHPYKDAWYINHRYFEHPIYKYDVYGLKNETRVGALLVCREQEYNGEKALRIVDYIGEDRLFAGISDFLEKKLQIYEYIDFYCYGFHTEYVKKAGMVELQEDDTNVIPNYFSPYVCENIDIWVGSPNGNVKFFKADGDQDRPN